MEPAYHIPLTKDELALLGEISAIQGQIDYLMLGTVELLLLVSTPLGQKILGSTNVEVNVEIWTRVIEEKCTAAGTHELAARVKPLMKEFSAGRNSYLHTVYGHLLEDEGFTLTPSDRPIPTSDSVARRVRNSKDRPISELVAVRDLAAEISRLVSQVYWRYIRSLR